MRLLALISLSVFMTAGVFSCDPNSHGHGEEDLPTSPEVRLQVTVRPFCRPDLSRALTVQCFAEPSSNARQYGWDFGDGETSQVRDPDHRFRAAGDYLVKLRACETEDFNDPMCGNGQFELTVN